LSALLVAAEAEDKAFLLNKRGVARVGLQQRELAYDDFVAALDCNARHAPALTNLGNLLLERGEIDAAIARYEAAAAADPEYAVAYLNLGAAYKRANRFPEAVRAMRHAHRLEGRRPARPTHHS